MARSRMTVTIEQADAWGRRDAQRAIALAKELPGEIVADVFKAPPALLEVLDTVDPGEPGSSARRFASQWQYVEDDTWVGPEDVYSGGLISENAAKAADAGGAVWDTYWDAFRDSTEAANVAILPTMYHLPDGSLDGVTSLYVIDKDRFPRFNEKNLLGFHQDGVFYVDEVYAQIAYLPPSRWDRLKRRLRR
jgi:hypothetical protein